MFSDSLVCVFFLLVQSNVGKFWEASLPPEATPVVAQSPGGSACPPGVGAQDLLRCCGECWIAQGHPQFTSCILLLSTTGQTGWGGGGSIPLLVCFLSAT